MLAVASVRSSVKMGHLRISAPVGAVRGGRSYVSEGRVTCLSAGHLAVTQAPRPAFTYGLPPWPAASRGAASHM